MKKIINGKLYDTYNSNEICSWTKQVDVFGVDVKAIFTLHRERVTNNPLEGLTLSSWGGVSTSDVKVDESKGEFFLSIVIGGFGKITPLTFDQAKRTFEEHSELEYSLEEDYEKYFGIKPAVTGFEQIKAAFKAGAEAKQKQYEEAQNHSSPDAEV